MVMVATTALQSPQKRRSCHRTTFTGVFLAVVLVSALCLWNNQQEVTRYLVPCGRDDGQRCSAQPLVKRPSWRVGPGTPLLDSDGPTSSGSTKRILFWVPFFGSPDYYFGLGREPFARCPVSNCETTTDRLLLNDSDAVIFHHRDTKYHDLPQWRSPTQRWVFFLMESPSNTYPDLRLFQGLFNWTMTYRSDSDVVARYAYVRPITPDDRQGGSSDNGSAAAKRRRNPFPSKKRRLASWLVSNCRTEGRREDYVDELRDYMSVDVFGKCHGRPCDDDGGDCQERVLRDYKFYLSFENSICRDYVTEKFFKVLQASDTVPVAYGGADYGAVAPPHSYVDARDFASPRLLADYLKMLDRNGTLYRRYFRWKARYRVVTEPLHFCDLCAKLHAATARDTKVYGDIYDWWMTQGNCTSGLVKLDY